MSFPGQKTLRRSQVGRRIYGRAENFHNGDADSHPALKRTQLFKALQALQRAGRQFNETVEGGTFVNIKTAMFVPRKTLKVGERVVERDGGTGKIKRPAIFIHGDLYAVGVGY